MVPASATDAVASPVGESSSPVVSRGLRPRASSRASSSELLLTVRPPLTCTTMISDSAW